MRPGSGPVALIIPPSPFLLDERVFVSLGVLKVAAALRAVGIAVEVLDLSGTRNYLDLVTTFAAETAATAVGITMTTPQFPAAAQIAQRLRRLRPDLRLIGGGPHPTLVHAALAHNALRATRAFAQITDLFDVVICGDGERAMVEALRPAPPAVIDADAPRGALFLTPAQLTALPFPARDLVDLDTYRYQIEGHRATSLIAQLGCPFGCGFCGGRSSPMLRRTRQRDSASVVAELEQLYCTYGYTGFMFYDDELNVNPNLVALLHGIADLQARLGVDFRLRGFLKAQLFTDEQATAMHGAGFRWVLVGFESGSARILSNIRKRATRDENTRCMEIATRHGLKVKALMSLGHPGEAPETVADTVDWVRQVAPADLDVTIITPYPGAPYYDQAVPSTRYPHAWEYTIDGDRLYSLDVDYAETADYYKGDPDGGYRAYVFTDALTPTALVAARDQAESSLRQALQIPAPPRSAARDVETSMGQLPGAVFRQDGRPDAPD